MRLTLGLTALASFLASVPFLAAQTSPSRLNATSFPAGYAPGFTLAPATGALAWNLPIGEVPGPIPIPVVFRFQASMNADLARPAAGAQGLSGGPAPSVLRYRGIWSSLHFGFIAPPRDLGQGLAEEGTQILEDGTILRDRDWTRRAEEGCTLPLAFGFNAPPEGYATDGSGTYALFSATLDGLGTWKSQVAQLTSANAFQVLLDAGKARIYAYYDTLKTFVPVLWVDRTGKGIGSASGGPPARRRNSFRR